MASRRGRWLLDQMPSLFGAWGSSAGSWLSVFGTGDSVEGVGATDLVSNWRAVVVKDRGASRASPRADRRQVDDSMVNGGLVGFVFGIAGVAVGPRCVAMSGALGTVVRNKRTPRQISGL